MNDGLYSVCLMYMNMKQMGANQSKRNPSDVEARRKELEQCFPDYKPKDKNTACDGFGSVFYQTPSKQYSTQWTKVVQIAESLF